jgi:2-polyprenyl-3-methyl-5-hydroxy-6-metoxy-1,4-benzoquinol methylase
VKVHERFETPFLRNYARSKLRSDPVYGAVLPLLANHPHPIVDVGCGIGLLPMLLRESGFARDIVGIDFDARKIEAARKAAPDVEFRIGDARDPLPPNHTVVMLDLLHYFTGDEQRRILANAAAAVPPGGMIIVRDAIDDGSWRYRATFFAESFARLIFWLKAERLNFPKRETLHVPGFANELRPLWGRTPFNNYLFVARRLVADSA